MRQLNSHGQILVWTTVKAKFDGIQEDDIRTICKAWYNHGLSQLDRQNESLWTLYGDNVDSATPSNAHSAIDDTSSQNDEVADDDEQQKSDTSSSQNNGLPYDDQQPQDDTSTSQNDDLPYDDEQPQEDTATQNDESPHDDESSEANGSSDAKESSQDEPPLRDEGRRYQSKHPIINTNPPKRRRATSTEMLQEYTKSLEEKDEATKKLNIDDLRGSTFAQEALERIARMNALSEFVDNASPVASKGRQ